MGVINVIKLDMSNEEYHQSEAISASAVKTVAQKSLGHWKYGEIKQSIAMEIGTATHTLVLEPDNKNLVICGPATRRGKAWEDAKIEAHANGAVVLTEPDYQHVQKIADSVRSNTQVKNLLSGDLVVEASVFNTDPDHKVEVRCRPDAWRKDISAIIDLKTTIDASPEGFQKTCANFGYHIQEAFYRRVMEIEGYEIDRFIFVAVEKVAPFATGIYELDETSLLEGRAAVNYALEKMANAKISGEYPTGFGERTTLQIPRWAFKFTKSF